MGRKVEAGRGLGEAYLRAAYETDRFGLEYGWAIRRGESEEERWLREAKERREAREKRIERIGR